MTALFAQKRDIRQELEALLGETAQLQRGAFVPHETIEDVSGIKRDEKIWTKLIKKWKEEMLARGKWVKAATPLGTGYKILTLDEQRISEPSNLQRQAMKRLLKAAACVGSIPESELDEAGRNFQVARLHQLGQIKQADERQRAEVTSWLSNPEMLPKLNGKQQKIV